MLYPLSYRRSSPLTRGLRNSSRRGREGRNRAVPTRAARSRGEPLRPATTVSSVTWDTPRDGWTDPIGRHVDGTYIRPYPQHVPPGHTGVAWRGSGVVQRRGTRSRTQDSGPATTSRGSRSTTAREGTRMTADTSQETTANPTGGAPTTHAGILAFVEEV